MVFPEPVGPAISISFPFGMPPFRISSRPVMYVFIFSIKLNHVSECVDFYAALVV